MLCYSVYKCEKKNADIEFLIKELCQILKMYHVVYDLRFLLCCWFLRGLRSITGFQVELAQ